MTRSTCDLSFQLHVNGKLSGLAESYVDDILHAGDKKFEEHTNITLEKFESRDRVMDRFTFAGIEIESCDDGRFLLHQSSQADRLQVLPEDASYKMFCSRRMQAAWLTHTRPEVACVIAQAAQITEYLFSKEHLKVLNSAIRSIKQKPKRIGHKKAGCVHTVTSRLH